MLPGGGRRSSGYLRDLNPAPAHSLLLCQLESSRVFLAGIETNEFGIGRTANPVVYSAILFTQVSCAFEKDHILDLPAIHFDCVFVWSAAFPLKGRLPGAVLECHRAVEAHF